jgi:molybdate transport system substrate-binding protein
MATQGRPREEIVMQPSQLRAIAPGLLCLFLLSIPADAAEIKVMISAGFFSVYKELGPAFEKSTGNTLVTTRGPSVGDSPEAIPTRLARGEEADVVIMDGVGVDLLDQRELARPGSRIPLAESFIGMVVRAGQPKPDISTMDGLRNTLLAAKSIAVSDSSSGTYLSAIGFKKLGVADEVAGKTRKIRGPPSGEVVAAVVARGEAEVGFQQVPELLHVPGVDFVGTVPSDVQPPTLFVGALPKNSQQPDAAIALMRFLSSAEAAEVITKAGLKPLQTR